MPPNPGINNSAANFTLQQALMKIGQLEQQLAELTAMIKIKPGGTIEINAPAGVSIKSSAITLTAGKITLDAGMTQASGVVKCQTLMADAVVAASYTPGAGNVW